MLPPCGPASHGEGFPCRQPDQGSILPEQIAPIETLETSMNRTLHVSQRISWSALAVMVAACAGLMCVGCAQNARPVAASTAAISRPSTIASAAPSATGSPSATTPSDLPVKLVADAKVRQELLATFIAFRSNGANTPGYAAIPPSAVAGIAPGTLHYGYDPATGTYWALVGFNATKAASQTAAFVGFQDGGNEAVFRQLHGGSWRVKYVGPCMTGLPVSVAAALGLTASPYPGC
jgi:hypothetical protein